MFGTQSALLHGDPDAFPAGANTVAINPQATTGIAMNFMPTPRFGIGFCLLQSA
jgi:hypothetical protein